LNIAATLRFWKRYFSGPGEGESGEVGDVGVLTNKLQEKHQRLPNRSSQTLNPVVINGVSLTYTVLLIPSLAEMQEVLAILSWLLVIEGSCNIQVYFHSNQNVAMER